MKHAPSFLLSGFSFIPNLYDYRIVLCQRYVKRFFSVFLNYEKMLLFLCFILFLIKADLKSRCVNHGIPADSPEFPHIVRHAVIRIGTVRKIQIPVLTEFCQHIIKRIQIPAEVLRKRKLILQIIIQIISVRNSV